MDGPAEPGLALARDGTPQLALDGYAGPLEGLLELARTHQVDLRRIPLAALLDQLIEALRGPQALGQKGDWLVMAAQLLVLRSPTAGTEAGLPRHLNGLFQQNPPPSGHSKWNLTVPGSRRSRHYPSYEKCLARNRGINCEADGGSERLRLCLPANWNEFCEIVG